MHDPSCRRTLELVEGVEDDAPDVEVKPHAHRIRGHQHLPRERNSLRPKAGQQGCGSSLSNDPSTDGHVSKR